MFKHNDMCLINVYSLSSHKTQVKKMSNASLMNIVLTPQGFRSKRNILIYICDQSALKGQDLARGQLPMQPLTGNESTGEQKANSA